MRPDCTERCRWRVTCPYGRSLRTKASPRHRMSLDTDIGKGTIDLAHQWPSGSGGELVPSSKIQHGIVHE
ncbi:hypothetical protein EVAR_75808_1 [Eumeta japonica]|uniref:Uncharacterized protein n=1 Tax=Eumeta variegata TaxID=151549 RepID=A0A4C1TCY1_EUMVA|nr:hypothetical protein EVAR_75808_1 [Eumeta japonica]